MSSTYKKAIKFTCVICKELIRHPRCNVYTCGNDKCAERYKNYLKKRRQIKQNLNRKIFKLKQMLNKETKI